MPASPLYSSVLLHSHLCFNVPLFFEDRCKPLFSPWLHCFCFPLRTDASPSLILFCPSPLGHMPAYPVLLPSHPCFNVPSGLRGQMSASHLTITSVFLLSYEDRCHPLPCTLLSSSLLTLLHCSPCPPRTDASLSLTRCPLCVPAPRVCRCQPLSCSILPSRFPPLLHCSNCPPRKDADLSSLRSLVILPSHHFASIL
jgi:hypothetical protein